MTKPSPVQNMDIVMPRPGHIMALHCINIDGKYYWDSVTYTSIDQMRGAHSTPYTVLRRTWDRIKGIVRKPEMTPDGQKENP